MVMTMARCIMKERISRGVTQNQISQANVAGLGSEGKQSPRAHDFTALNHFAITIGKRSGDHAWGHRRPPENEIGQRRARLIPIQKNHSASASKAVDSNMVGSSGRRGKGDTALTVGGARDVIVADDKQKA